MNGAKTDERNYYAESYIALIEAIIKETASKRNSYHRGNQRCV